MCPFSVSVLEHNTEPLPTNPTDPNPTPGMLLMADLHVNPSSEMHVCMCVAEERLLKKSIPNNTVSIV